jgi:hypothetical protein
MNDKATFLLDLHIHEEETDREHKVDEAKG